ncbi:MAG: hypothetical protein WCW63_02300 [Acholeplasmataceae bacterium]
MDKEGDHMIIHHKYHLNNQLLIRGFEYKFKDFRMNKIDHQFDEKSLFAHLEFNKSKDGKR